MNRSLLTWFMMAVAFGFGWAVSRNLAGRIGI